MRNIEYIFNHVNGLYFEITADEGHNDAYSVKFLDRSLTSVIYESEMKVGTWVKLNRKYLSDILILIYLEDKIVAEISILEALKGKKIFISFDSSSLGDTLAWMPCCDYFQKMLNCELIVSTFRNELFEGKYPNITFVGRGVVVNDLIGMFELGWFYNKDKEPVNPATIPLQQAAKNILFINDKTEFLPNLNYQKKERPIRDRYVCISTKSTAQLKLWYYWQELVDMLKENGYKVFEISKDQTELTGLEHIDDKSIPSVMNYIYHCEYFIGLSSGLSWLAWGMRKRVYMIANFTNEEHEFESNCIKIINKNVCNSCWNNEKFKFDKGNWFYCPEHEDTPRQFECHKSITANDVMQRIEQSQPKNIF